MPNFFSNRISLRSLLVLITLLLIVVVIVASTYRSFFQKLFTGQTASQPTTLVQVVNTTEIVPVNEISSLIKPCLFVFLNSCAVTPVDSSVVDPVPPDPLQNNGPEQVAQKDIFYAISSTPNRGLAEYSVHLDPGQVAELFPEFTQDASISGGVSIPAATVIARVADKYNINQRVLLVLMEVMNTGAGPLMSGSANYITPYSQENSGFLTQLVKAAQDLQSSKAKYDLIVQDKGKLPTSVTFFDKEYAVSSSANAETLAIADFLANNIKTKKDFEKAIYIPTSEKKDVLTPDFYSIYKFIYNSDPR